MTTEQTVKVNNVVFLLQQDQILLAMKKRRFGEGKWNGLGGKLEPGESMRQGAAREVFEESGVTVVPEELEKVALVYFTAPAVGKVETHVFRTRCWEGTPQETEEMRPQWFRFEDIPYDAMWSADQKWLPKVINGDRFIARIVFDDQDNMVECSFEPATAKELE